MPIKHAALKSLKQSQKNYQKNQKVKNEIKILEKSLRKAVEEKNKAKVDELYLKFQKTLDKAVQNGVIKINKASRKKSRLSKLGHK